MSLKPHNNCSIFVFFLLFFDAAIDFFASCGYELRPPTQSLVSFRRYESNLIVNPNHFGFVWREFRMRSHGDSSGDMLFCCTNTKTRSQPGTMEGSIPPKIKIIKTRNILFVHKISHLRRWLLFGLRQCHFILYYSSRTMAFMRCDRAISACDTDTIGMPMNVFAFMAMPKQRRTTEKCVFYYLDGRPRNYLNYTN